jgi:hypothetical protein
MATAVLFIGWSRPHVGMEDKAYGFLTTEGTQFLKERQGKSFERMETIALTAHGGDLNGCIILFGERAKLDELRRTDEFEAFVFKMSALFDRLGVIPGLNWDGIQAVMARRQKMKP